MLGLMQNQALSISSLIEFANRHHGDGEIVSRRVEGDIHRYTYKEATQRSRQLARVLDSLKLQPGDRVAYWAEAEDNKEPSPNITATGKQWIVVLPPENPQLQNGRQPRRAQRLQRRRRL